MGRHRGEKTNRTPSKDWVYDRYGLEYIYESRCENTSMITLVDMSVRVLIVFLDFNLVYVFLKLMKINNTNKKKKKKKEKEIIKKIQSQNLK